MNYHTQKTNDKNEHFLQLQFSFVTENDKLIIQAFSTQHNHLYVGELSVHHNTNFEDIKQLLNKNQYKTIFLTQQLLRIKVGVVSIDLFIVNKSSLQIQKLKQMLIQSIQRQQQMSMVINSQNNQIHKQQNMINQLRTIIEEVRRQSVYKKVYMNKSQIMNVDGQDYQTGSKDEQQIKLQQLKLQLAQIKAQYKETKDDMISLRVYFDELRKQIKQISQNIHKNNQLIIIDQQKTSQHKNNQTTHTIKTLTNSHNKITKKSIISQATYSPLLQTSQKSIIIDPNQISIIDVENNNYFNIEQFQQQQQQEQLQKKIVDSFQWSQQMKSKQIVIYNKIATKVSNSFQFKFCLLNASFTSKLKTTKYWAFKINKKTQVIRLGICLKSKIQKYNYNSQNIKWTQTGHGLYMIGSCRGCYSHSQKQFNYVQKSFKYGSGDIIYCQYDPNNNKLRFCRNKLQQLVISIISPPQNDAYHPCVAIYYQNSSVQIIE